MTRYERIFRELEKQNVNDKAFRLCPAKGPCACTGCLNTRIEGITERLFKMYKSGELKSELIRQGIIIKG